MDHPLCSDTLDIKRVINGYVVSVELRTVNGHIKSMMAFESPESLATWINEWAEERKKRCEDYEKYKELKKQCGHMY